MHVYMYVQRSEKNRPSLKHHYSFKHQKLYSVLNACVFINTIQEEMEKDVE